MPRPVPRRSRAGLVLAGLLALGAALPSPAAARASYAVGSRSYTFVDRSRPTAPNGSAPGAPSRTLPTLVLYPAVGAPGGASVEGARPVRPRRPFPLVVFSHGFGASGPAYRFLLERFAQAGYVVAAPTFPLSNGAAAGGANGGDYVNQPGDVSFTITRMLRLARQPRFAGVVSRRDIGVLGHSLGAITTLGVAANSCCLDRRIDAAVAFSGIQLPFGTGRWFAQPGPPLMLVHGDADGTVPYAGSLGAYANAPAPKVLLTLLKAGHVPFLAPWLEPTVASITDFLDGYLEHRPRALARLARDGNVPGATTLREELVLR